MPERKPMLCWLWQQRKRGQMAIASFFSLFAGVELFVTFVMRNLAKLFDYVLLLTDCCWLLAICNCTVASLGVVFRLDTLRVRPRRAGQTARQGRAEKREERRSLNRRRMITRLQEDLFFASSPLCYLDDVQMPRARERVTRLRVPPPLLSGSLREPASPMISGYGSHETTTARAPSNGRSAGRPNIVSAASLLALVEPEHPVHRPVTGVSIPSI